MKALTLYQLIGDVDEKLVVEARPEHKHRRHIRPLLLAAVIALLLAGFAEATQGSISDLFAPLFRSSRTEIIDNIGRPVSAAATSDGYTLTADAVFGDRHHLTVAFTLTRDDGEPLPLGVDFDDYFDPLDYGSGSVQMHWDRAGLPENQMRYLVEIESELPLFFFRRHAHFAFQGLSADEDHLSDGSWELAFTLRYRDATVNVPVDDITVTDELGWTYTIRKVQLSPFSVTMELDIPNYYYTMEEEEARSYGMEHNWTHLLNISLRMKDGSESPSVSNGGQSGGALNEPTLKATYHGQFDPPVLPEDVEAIIVCGTEIPVK